MKLHNITSFFEHGIKEKSTWIGIAILFGWLFHDGIHTLINNILINPFLANSISRGIGTIIDKISDSTATFVGGLLTIIYSSFNRNK